MKPEDRDRKQEIQGILNSRTLNGHIKKGKDNLAFKSATLPGYRPTLSRSPPPRGTTRCNCCPYGYHIDLDFVRYCEALYSDAYLENLKQLRRDRRKQRKSMEARLGLGGHHDQPSSGRKSADGITNEKKSESLPISPISPSPSVLPSASTVTTLQSTTLLHTNDALRDAVLDFEEAFSQSVLPVAATVPDSGSGPPSPSPLPPTLHPLHPARAPSSASSVENAQIHQSGHLMTTSSQSEQSSSSFHLPSNGSMIPIMSMSMPPNFGMFRARSGSASSMSSQSSMSSVGFHMQFSGDFNANHAASQQMADTVAVLNSAGLMGSTSSPGFVGISRSVLTRIREQMATSLSKMKELEEQVKNLPVLQVKLSVLKEEKRLLMLQLKQKAGRYDQVSIGGGDTQFDKLSTDEEDVDFRLERLGSRGIVTPRRYHHHQNPAGSLTQGGVGDEFVSPPKLADCINAAIAQKREYEKLLVANRELKNVGTSCNQLLTRDIAVGSVPKRLVSIGVGSEMNYTPLVCSKCKIRSNRLHSFSNNSSSDLSDNEQEKNLNKSQRILKNKSNTSNRIGCGICKDNNAKTFASKMVNTEPQSPKLAGHFETRTKLESILKSRVSASNLSEVNKPIVSHTTGCPKCNERDKIPPKKHSALGQFKEQGTSPDLTMDRVLDARDSLKKTRTIHKGNDPIVAPMVTVSVQAGAIKKRDVAVEVKIAKATANSSVQVTEKTQPKPVTRSVAVGNILTDETLKFRKRSIGSGEHTVTEDLCSNCCKIKVSKAVGNFDVTKSNCNRCDANKKVSKGVGDCSVSDNDCEKCVLRQTETIGVGEGKVSELGCERCKTLPHQQTVLSQSIGVNTTSQTSPDLALSRASSTGSVGLRICDKCNATIQSVAKDFFDNNQLSPPPPAVPSRIPRLKLPVIDSPQPVSALVTSSSSCSGQTTTLTAISSAVQVVKSSSMVTTTSKKETQKKLTTYATFENIHASSEVSPVVIKESDKKSGTMKLPERPVIQAVVTSSTGTESSSSESESEGEGMYDITLANPLAKMSTVYDPLQIVPRQKVELSKEMRGACKVLNDYLIKPERGDGKKLNSSLSIIQKEWFKIAAQKNANPLVVEDFVDAFEEFSRHLLNRVVNSGDANGNTAMHYAVSNGNFDVVSVLLDSKVCDINKQNKAGYTCIMLVSLAEIKNDTHKHVVQRLFQLGDVNIKATQNGQTALMLAVSHGRLDMVTLLLEAGAWVNLQDNDGSTALMCAAEHNHVEIVKQLLAHPDCDATLIDNDGSTALAVAMEAGHRDIGILLYASMNFSRGSSPYSSLRGRRRSSTPRSTPPPSRTPPPPSPARSRRSSSSLN